MNGRKERARLLLVILMILALMATGCGGGGGGGGGGGSDTDSPEDTIGDDTTPGDTTGDTTTGDDSPHVTITTYDLPGSNQSHLAIDGSNNIWVVNTGSNTVTKLNSSGAVIGTYVVVNAPRRVVIDSENNVWVFSSYGLTILNNIGSQIASNSSATIWDIAVDTSGNVLSYSFYPKPTNDNNPAICLMNETTGALESSVIDQIWSWDDNDGSGVSFDYLLIDSDNNYWLMGRAHYQIAKYDQSGTKLATHTDTNMSTDEHGSIASDSVGNIWYLRASSITKLNSSGVQIGDFPISNGTPSLIAIDGDDNIWVACMPNRYKKDPSSFIYYSYDNILKYDSNGNLIASYPQFNDMTYDVVNSPNPSGIAIDGSGNVWVTNANKISKIPGVAAPVNTPYQPGK